MMVSGKVEDQVITEMVKVWYENAKKITDFVDGEPFGYAFVVVEMLAG